MTDILLIIGLVLLASVIVLLVLVLKKSSQGDSFVLASRLDAFEKTQERTEHTVKEEADRSRSDLGKTLREQREEVAAGFKTLGESVVQRMTEDT